MPNINFYSPQTGRRIKEDNSIVNTADMIEAIYNKIVNGQVDMQLSGSNVTDAQAIPIRQKQKTVTLANAVAIANTTNNTFNLITHGGLTEDEIRQYRNFKISIINSHDQSANIELRTALKALGATGLTSSAALYSESGALKANPGRLTLTGKNGGTGASSDIKVVPALNGDVHSNLFVQVTFPVAPTTGSITIVVEMN